MSVVVVAEHLQLGHTVALKFLKTAYVANKEALGRFLREARAVAQLNSPHIARIFDVGALDSGEPYIVMEHLVGEDMGELLTREGPVTEKKAADYIMQACFGLAEAHARGIIHRDLKPGNLFLVRRSNGRPLVKVLDFGVAKAMGPFEDGVQTLATVMGTPAYSSPEQLLSPHRVDARSDVYSLGVVLYQLVSGSRPFPGSKFIEVSAQALRDEPRPLQGARGPLTETFRALVMKCLAKDPRDRYQTVAALAEALAALSGSAESARAKLSELTARVEAVEAPSSVQSTAPTVSAIEGTDFGSAMSGAASQPFPPFSGRLRGFIRAKSKGLALLFALVGIPAALVYAMRHKPVATETGAIEAAALPSPSSTQATHSSAHPSLEHATTDRAFERLSPEPREATSAEPSGPPARGGAPSERPSGNSAAPETARKDGVSRGQEPRSPKTVSSPPAPAARPLTRRPVPRPPPPSNAGSSSDPLGYR